ncbi:hypothetical protein B0J17DRAFT_654231 [Rhizoctonia solani]|nr:hypothetical protein B0J17DRAFT_654231 [Rhizoctonia solani]
MMSKSPVVITTPKKVLVVLYDQESDGKSIILSESLTKFEALGLSQYILTNETKGCNQIVHYQDIQDHETPQSRIRTLSSRVRLRSIVKRPRNPAIMQAYAFVVNHFAYGDEVVILVEEATEARLNMMEQLVRCLIIGTPPTEERDDKPLMGQGLDNLTPTPVPVKCVAVGFWANERDVLVLNDELLSRFPVSIPHITCWKYGTQDEASSCEAKRAHCGRILHKKVHKVVLKLILTPIFNFARHITFQVV